MAERYQIQDKIGQGGLGTVYKAVDSQLKRPVALKRVVTVKDKESTGDSADKLLQEAHTLSALQHPNIVTVYDVGKDSKGAYVVMELLEGETLEETIARGALPFEDFKEVVTQTLEGLIAAHAAGLIHRDLKPSNVMLRWLPSEKFQLKILDFGLAKFSKTPSLQTIDQGDAIMGSIYFMAPEQFERIPLDVRTDLYSLGCIYYYTLTAKYPFRGENAPQVMASHLQHRVKPLEELRPDLPPYVCHWVMHLLARSMEHRPDSAKDALREFQAGAEAYALLETTSQAMAAAVQPAPPFPPPSQPIPQAIPAAPAPVAAAPMPGQPVATAYPGQPVATGVLPAAEPVVDPTTGQVLPAVPPRGAANGKPIAWKKILVVTLVSAALLIGGTLLFSGMELGGRGVSTSVFRDEDGNLHPVISAYDVKTVDEMRGAWATVEGVVRKVKINTNGDTYHIFFSKGKDKAVVLAISKANLDEVFMPGSLGRLKGHRIQARGTVTSSDGMTAVKIWEGPQVAYIEKK